MNEREPKAAATVVVTVPPVADRRPVEDWGREICGVRGYEPDGKALHDLPRSGGQAWLYNALRSRLLLPMGRLMTEAEFRRELDATAGLSLPGHSGRERT